MDGLVFMMELIHGFMGFWLGLMEGLIFPGATAMDFDLDLELVGWSWLCILIDRMIDWLAGNLYS